MTKSNFCPAKEKMEKIGPAKFCCFNPCFMRVRFFFFACMVSHDIEVTAVTKSALFSAAADVVFLIFIILGSKSVQTPTVVEYPSYNPKKAY